MDVQDGGGGWEAALSSLVGGLVGGGGESLSKDGGRGRKRSVQGGASAAGGGGGRRISREEVEALLLEHKPAADAQEWEHAAERDLLLWVACARSRELCGEVDIDFVVDEFCGLDSLLTRCCLESEEVGGTVEPGYVVQAVAMALGGFEVIARMLIAEEESQQARAGRDGGDVDAPGGWGLSGEGFESGGDDTIKAPMWNAASPVVWHLLEAYQGASTAPPEVQIETSYKSKLTNKDLNRMTVEETKRLVEWRALRTRRAKNLVTSVFEINGRPLPPKVQRMLYDRPKKEQDRILRDIEYAKFGVLNSLHEIKRQQRVLGRALGPGEEDEDSGDEGREAARGGQRQRADWREKFNESAAKAGKEREAAVRALEAKASADAELRYQVTSGVTQTIRLQRRAGAGGPGSGYRLAIMRDFARTRSDSSQQQSTSRPGLQRNLSTSSMRTTGHKELQRALSSSSLRGPAHPGLQRVPSASSICSAGPLETPRRSLLDYLRERPARPRAE